MEFGELSAVPVAACRIAMGIGDLGDGEIPVPAPTISCLEAPPGWRGELVILSLIGELILPAPKLDGELERVLDLNGGMAFWLGRLGPPIVGRGTGPTAFGGVNWADSRRPNGGAGEGRGVILDLGE